MNSTDGKFSKNSRTLDMYVRLCEGKCINKEAEAARFGVNERSVQRDIDDIRAFLDERAVSDSSEHRQIVYDRTKKGFVIEGIKDSIMTNSEILAVCKILLDSRAFKKDEISSILDKLIAGCVPLKNMKLVSDLVANEKYHYVELNNKSSIEDIMWDLGNDIKNCEILEITYEKHVPKVQEVKRIIEPVSILFSEYYFYLNAYIDKEDDKKRYVRAYDYPAVFRIDRIKSCRQVGKKYNLNYMNRFQEGEFRKRVQFMFPGKLIKLQFKYEGSSIDVILDRLPTAKIIKKNGNEYIIEAEVFGKGILMWLLSQGKSVEILKPETLREEMKEMLKEMLGKYG